MTIITKCLSSLLFLFTGNYEAPKENVIYVKFAYLSGLSVSVLDNVLYAVGGHSGSAYLRTVQKYDPHEDLWEDEESMGTCRCSFGLTVL